MAVALLQVMVAKLSQQDRVELLLLVQVEVGELQLDFLQVGQKNHEEL